ncbi:MAG: DUF1573 domain-containing protein [Acidobacteriota bacterium]
MKLKLISLSLALALAFALTAAAQEKKGPSTANGSPKLVIDSLIHDFGEVKAGTPLNFTFVIKNQGKADLEITKVAPG